MTAIFICVLWAAFFIFAVSILLWITTMAITLIAVIAFVIAGIFRKDES